MEVGGEEGKELFADGREYVKEGTFVVQGFGGEAS